MGVPVRKFRTIEEASRLVITAHAHRQLLATAAGEALAVAESGDVNALPRIAEILRRARQLNWSFLRGDAT